MIQELVEFGRRVTKDKNRALKEEYFSITLVIDKEGRYQQFLVGNRMPIESEVITAKKGKARFLLDKPEEVLGYSIDVSKLETFRKNLEPFKNTERFAPIFKFYDKENANGLKKAIRAYIDLGDEFKEKKISFAINSSVLLKENEICDSINKHYKIQQTKKGESLNLKEISFDVCIVINENGEFQNFRFDESYTVQTIMSSTKKKETYVLLGNDDDILGITKNSVDNKHQLFMDKLFLYKDELTILEPVFKFYQENNEDGLKKAIIESVFSLSKDSTNENITFMVKGETILLKTDEVKNAIIKHFVNNERCTLNKKVCSICGKSDNPVLDEPHGLVRMPKGQSAGCALVSYNAKAFESYGLKGNMNSSICKECARNYIEGLSFLLSNGHNVEDSDKQKQYFHYNHRINISDNTVALFWTRENTDMIDPFLAFDSPDVAEIKNLFNSVLNGKQNVGSVVDTNMFYTCTLSSAAARIAVRDWTAICLNEYKMNLAEWFHDIEIVNSTGEFTYSPLRWLINASQRDKKTGEKPKADLYSKARIGAVLWNASIKGHSYKIPLEVLQYVLNRIWKKDRFSLERAALIKLVI